ncbi:tRNA nucleotidyltransferase (CCA-adding enzyme) [Geothermobacter ehrlichii]|uniref:tRNA nucleotidyltransferase (CCA-adding enzyme) n=1 Tax=Geothermobacter ehrlichii TaxID=213224 RepID=A0A5D3WMK6_9BACT|nr:CBS domain-containing protein [Geothermobacter ehrlichii]TYP00091.1 tRNA nucleotidyltransferase (CCA-adding enzyme) [Geothermobacter ehrlichii]
MEIITTHVNADFDCLGAMIAARKLYPEAEMVFPGSRERNLREFFLRSTAYAFDFKRLRDIDLAAVDRLILVDVSQSERIGPFGDLARNPQIQVHIYDHHPAESSDLEAELADIRPVGSTVTVFCQIFMERGIRPDPEEATLMMLGLYEDTGSLQFSNITRADFEAAAFLHECGAVMQTVSEFLTQELTAEQVDVLHQLIKNRQVLSVNGVDISISHATTAHYVGDLAVLAHKLKDMENLDALIIAARMEDRVFMVGRSRIPEVHVGSILEEFGGGGHSFAASGTVKGQTLVQILDRLPGVLQRQVNPRWRAAQLMSSPAKTIAPTQTIAEARDLLTRYHINVLPVVEQGRVVGLISRQTAERAAFHGLERRPVGDYMESDFSVAAPDSSLQYLQELIVDRNQRLVPIVDESGLVGVLTRTDLLRKLIEMGRIASSGQDAARDLPDTWLKKKQLARFLRERLPKRIHDLLRDFGQVADDLGLNLFVVGGFVRDLLLRQENFDIDLVVEGDGIAFARRCAERFACRFRSHEKFGTAVIIFEDGFKVDVASARMEYYSRPAALPTVEYASIKLDLFRRDFTINTLAIALNRGRYGELLDFFGGQRDLKDKAIRVLHNLSFVEDPTRVFRAVRFEQRLGFRIGRPTEHLLRGAVRQGFVERVGGSRLFRELELILREPDPWPAVERLASFDLLRFVHPQLKLDKTLARVFAEASRVVHWYQLLFLERPCRPWLIYFLCLTSALGREAMAEACRRLNVPPRIARLVTEGREEALAVRQRMRRWRHRKKPPAASEIYRLLHPLERDLVLFVMSLAEDERIKQWISHYFNHLAQVKCELDGDDLRQLGIPPGPVYRAILDDLLNARLDGRVTGRDEELAYVRRRHLS